MMPYVWFHSNIIREQTDVKIILTKCRQTYLGKENKGTTQDIRWSKNN